MFDAAAVRVKPDDLSRVVNAVCAGVGAAWGIDRRVGIGRHLLNPPLKGTSRASDPDGKPSGDATTQGKRQAAPVRQLLPQLRAHSRGRWLP